MLHRLLSLSITLTISTLSFSQKKPLDHTVYDAWETVTTMQVSPSGDVITWIVAPQEGDATLYIKTLGKKGRELNIPRGASPVILEDGGTLICNIRPFFADTRQAKIKKKKADDMPRDTVAIIDLKTGGVTKFPHVKTVKTARLGAEAIAFSSADTSLIPKKERKKKDNGAPVLVYHIKTGKTDTLRHIDTFTFDRSGRTLAFIEKKGKHSTQVGYFDVTTSTTTMLPDTSAYHSLPVFDQNGTKAAFLQASDTLDGSKHCSIWEITLGANEPRLVVSPDSREGFPAGYGITENSRLSYSHDGTRLFSGIQEFIAPKDTSLVPFETAGLDIWNWDSPELPPMTKINLKRDLTRTLKAVVDGNRLIPMTTSRYDRLYNVNRGDASWLLSEDLTASIVSTQWDSQPVSTLSVVNISDGSRTKIAEGRYENVTPSPLGSYILYFDLKQRNWLIFNTNTKSTSNITSTLPVNFWDEDNDRPMLSTPYGIADWAADDSFVLLYDRYDIWRIDLPSIHASCLTQGRAKGLTYRYLQTRDEETIGLTPNSTIYLSIFDNSTKENGLASLNLAKPSALSHIAIGPNSYTGFAKARDRDTFIYRKGNYADPMDIYYTTRPGREEIRLSSINPQQK
ncbi:MAG: hypothetical protein IK143_06310, partial [Bacteroidales bacterium]|nr:hypothetical protein [Bacteroidales bacterium]